ncbi:hypothetical protein [Bacteroides thetaiotaomicron]|jgi:hypothetical protein|uniref:hypothetical protein n=1 Tax=Bacteroides thetaiotaomicron TaxID=818 RepID=UPI004063AE7A
MSKLHELSWRTNINTYTFRGKYIVLYDDHRTLLNILFEAKKLGEFAETPNLIYFDLHDDACTLLPKSQLLERMGVKDLSEATSKQFWSFVEFDLGVLDDDWLLTGMELDLIKNAILIGQEENHHIQDMNGRYKSEDRVEHELYSISHLQYSLNNRGCLGDSIIKEPYYQNVRDIMQYHQGRFDGEDIKPFVLDFDLDCFTTECREKTYAWPEDIFRKEYIESYNVRFFMENLLDRASFITICREPDCCGGIGEANKILNYLDRYFFDGALSTEPIS